jgi:hypothetical protein
MKFDLFLKQRSPKFMFIDENSDSHISALIFLSLWLVFFVSIWLSWVFWSP